MTFFRMIKTDFKRMFLSPRFYFAILGTALVTILNFAQEAVQIGSLASVYYLLKNSHGVGAFFEVFSVLAVLPFALSYWEDRRNGYRGFIETRVGRNRYCWSHLLVTFSGAAICIFLGMSIGYGVLLFRMPLIRAEELEALESNLVLGNGTNPLPYLAAKLWVEAVKYAFMAVFALMVSGQIKNLFVLFSTPVLFYYASLLLMSALPLPNWMAWYGLDGGSVKNSRELFIITGYFLVLTLIEGIIFTCMVKRGEQNG